MKDILTDDGEVVGPSATAIVGEAREISINDRLEDIPDGGNTRSVVGTEPAIEPVRVARDAHSVGVGGESDACGACGGGVELRLLVLRTADE